MILEGAALLVGLVALYYGSNWFIDGSVDLARLLGVSPFIIGLTIVAFGTSAPEAALSILASSEGAGGVILGNVMGSNIANIGLILGTSAVISPLIICYARLRVELFWMMGSMFMIVLMGFDGSYSTFEGILCLLAFAAFLTVLFRAAMRPKTLSALCVENAQASPARRTTSKARSAAVLASGLVILLIGAQAIVFGAVGLASSLGISEFVIGVTIVAVGTSLPEFAVSISGARKGNSDIVVSNIVGSNIFNSLFVLGLAATARGFSVQTDDMLVSGLAMLILGVMLLIVSRYHESVRKSSGTIMLLSYVAFVLVTVN